MIALIVNPPAILLQRIGKVPHGTENEHQLLLVMVGVAGFTVDLGHHDQVVVLVCALKGREMVAELITQDQDEIGHDGLRLSLSFRGRQNTPWAQGWFIGYAGTLS